MTAEATAVDPQAPLPMLDDAADLRIAAGDATLGGTEDGMVPASQAREIFRHVTASTYVEVNGMRHNPTRHEWSMIMSRVDDWMNDLRGHP